MSGTFDSGGTFDTSGSFDEPSGLTPWIWGSSSWDDTTLWTDVLSVAFAVQGTSSLDVPVEVLVELAMAITGTGDLTITSGDDVYVAPDDSGVYVSPTTARLYMRLPAMYRDYDRALVTTGPNSNRPLLRYLATIVDLAGQVESFVDSCAPATTSALTDPMLANQAWLPWLAQLVGMQVASPIVDAATVRTNIAGALTGIRRGSKPDIAAAVQSILTGTKTVTVADHYGGDPWTINIDTLDDETPVDIDNEAAFTWDYSMWDYTTEWQEVDPIVLLLEGLNVKPAGYRILHTRS